MTRDPRRRPRHVDGRRGYLLPIAMPSLTAAIA
jgi:hypothetical protein